MNGSLSVSSANGGLDDTEADTCTSENEDVFETLWSIGKFWLLIYGPDIYLHLWCGSVAGNNRHANTLSRLRRKQTVGISKGIQDKNSVAYFWLTNFSLLFAADFQANPTAKT